MSAAERGAGARHAATGAVDPQRTDLEAAHASLEAAMLAGLEPTAAEAQAMAEDADALQRAATERLRALGVAGEATVQGSVAKGTWLRGAGDIDLFLLLDPSVPESRLEGVTEQVARGVLQGVHKRYAQHPYLMGTFRGRAERKVDLVPAYRVAQAGARMSAVDRTPFHTAWVRSTLDAQGRGQARLLKAWMKGTATYGAQTAIGGFSGYLVEVLVVAHGGFRPVLSWLTRGAKPRRIALGPDEVSDEVAPLVVVDPVDPARNCAAAVVDETLQRAQDAAAAYLARPDRLFFEPRPPRAEDPDALRGALQAAGAAWTGLLLRPRTSRLDIVLPQFQKGARSVAAALAQAGFATRRLECMAAPDEREVLLQWLVEATPMADRRLHRGPPAAAGPHAERFRAKWESHPDRLGDIRTGADGTLEVEVRVPHRTPGEWLRAHAAKVPVGRHVADALPDARVLVDVAEAPAAWQPVVADFALGRRPWER